jgi:protein AATF/BFR2
VSALQELQKGMLERNPTTAHLLGVSSEGGGSEGTPSRKRVRMISTDDALEQHDALHNGIIGHLTGTMEKWFTKTNLARSKTNSKQFKALNRSIADQVAQVMSDKERLRKRTRLQRTQLTIIGKAAAPQDPEGKAAAAASGGGGGAVGAPATDTEIFDDGDFYQDLLRDLIERKASTADASDPVAMGRHWIELSRLRAKAKRKVDTKASKGRKLRYEVHEKLVNFMAPDPNAHPSTEQAKNDLFRSLFQ